MKKITIILLVLALVAALAAGVLCFKHYTAPLSYNSEHVGLDFKYSKIYTLSVRHDTYTGKEIHVLNLVDVSRVVPDMSEGPTAISVIEIPIAPTSTLESWVRDAPISNFYLSPDKQFSQATVGGEPALAYHYSGLYESDAVAVMHAGKIYLFAASWMSMNDAIRDDFKNLLSSVTFIP